MDDQRQPIGRETEFQRLVTILDQSSRNPAGVVAVVGTAGIGKSTLLRDVAAAATERGFVTGWGFASELEGAPPLWSWYEAITDVDPDQTVISWIDDAQSLEPQERIELFRAIADWLATQAATAPTVLILEDLHAADDTTVDLLAYISRRPMPKGLVLLTSTRDATAGDDRIRGPQLVLSGLSIAEAQALARSLQVDLDDSRAAALVHRTNGNPFFIQRLLEQGADRTQLPSDVNALLREQLDELDHDQRTGATALAVLGTSAPTHLVRRLLNRAFDSAAGRTEAPSVFRRADGTIEFRHALLREVIYTDLPAEERSRLHVAAADVLREESANPSVISHHLGRAAEFHPGPEAAEYASQAGHLALTIGALPEAIEQCSLATSVRRMLTDADALGVALIEEAVALGRAGRNGEAEERLVEAADRAELSTGTRQRLIREYGRLRWREEPNPSALHAERLVRLATDWFGDATEPASAAVFHTAMVSAADIRGIGRAALPHAEAAIEAAEASGDEQLIGEAHVALRRALMVHHGALERRTAASIAGARAAALANDDELLGRAQRLALCDAMATGDRATTVALIEVVEHVPSTALREHQALWRASLAAIEGRYDDANEILDEANKELAYLGVDAPALDFVRVVFEWDKGQFTDALARFEPLLVLVADIALAGAVAMGKAIDGDSTAAAQILDDNFDTLISDDITFLWPIGAAMFGEVAAAIDHPRIPEIYDVLAPNAGQCPIPAAAAVPWIGTFDRPLGLLSLRMGRTERAIEHLEAGLSIERRMKARPWIARSAAALAVAYEAAGDSIRAQTYAAEAAALQAELGMGDVLVVGRFDGEASAARPPIGAPQQRAGELRRDGSLWHLCLDGESSVVKHSTGMVYLARLVEQPDTDWHVLDLYASSSGAPAVVEGTGGEMLDEQARQAYQERYRQLAEQLDEAERFDDAGRAETLRIEIDALESELLSAFGLGGRARRMDDPTERARVNVRRSITRAFDRIAEQAPTVADHLKHRVETGRFCRYSSDRANPVTWRV
ncbi:MAG: AAA family ATPase [Acidimicrobiales bacterium]|nr:AAA family ATPase [Acidimicrobiales bacterium]